MSPIEQRVYEQTLLFRAALPSLLEQHRGKWVVFHDGSVRSLHNTEEGAFVTAVKELGSKAGFVVAPVEEVRPIPVTAAVMLGW